MKHETYEIRLESGARLIVVHVPGSPIFELETIVESGHKLAERRQYELPHLLEHLAFEGSKNYPNSRDFKYQVERYGIYHNAWTTVYRNGYLFYGAMEYWDHITQLSMEQLLRPLFTPLAIKQQIEVIINELTGKMNSAESKAGYAMYRLHRNGIVPDWPERIASLKSITRADITKYYERLYHPANFSHIVTGDVPKARVSKIVEMLEAAQADMPMRKPVDSPSIIPEPSKEPVHLVDYPYVDTSAFSLSFIQPGFDEERFESMRIFAAMLGSGHYSRLHEKVRQGGLSYGVGSSFGSSSDYGEMSVWDDTQTQHIVPLVRLVLDEILDLARGNFTDEELDRAIGYELGRHATRFQTALSITGWYVNEYLDDMPIRRPEEIPNLIRAVTKESVVEAAQKYFSRDNPYRYLVLAGQRDDTTELSDMLVNFGV